jgi:thioesterase domain-containing protein
MKDLKSARQMSEQGIRFVANAGLRVLDMRGGYVKCLMPFAGNGNHIGTMYAGALFTLADITAGALFLASFDSTQYFAIVKQLDLRFIKPANGDITAECSLNEEQVAALSAKAAQWGKADFTLAAALSREDGTVVAESRGVFQMRKLAVNGVSTPNERNQP